MELLFELPRDFAVVRGVMYRLKARILKMTFGFGFWFWVFPFDLVNLKALCGALGG